MVSTSFCAGIFNSRGTNLNGDALSSAIAATTKKEMLQPVEFVDAVDQYAHNLSKYKSKYRVLNPTERSTPVASLSESNLKLPSFPEVKSTSTATISETKKPILSVSNDKAAAVIKTKNLLKSKDGPPAPKIYLFSGNLDYALKKNSSRGSGLVNYGVTCYLNSAMQVLTYTAPLSNYLLRSSHRSHCKLHKEGSFCMLCTMHHHVVLAEKNASQSFRPNKVICNLKSIASHLSANRQEDAHEFFRYTVEALQNASLAGLNKNLDNISKRTTAIYQMFGGYLRSRITCRKCNNVSDSYDFCLDLSLDISKQVCETLSSCLRLFIKPENLMGGNAYKCSHCKAKCPAYKQFTIWQAPNILTIQLKRFTPTMAKNHRYVEYPLQLNLREYMSVKRDDIIYDLYAVLVHTGFGCSHGHYFTYAKAGNGQWFCYDDTSVYPVSAKTVQEQRAYLLFYSKRYVSSRKQNCFNKIEAKPREPILHKLGKEVNKVEKENGNSNKRKLLDDINPNEIPEKKSLSIVNKLGENKAVGSEKVSFPENKKSASLIDDTKGLSRNSQVSPRKESANGSSSQAGSALAEDKNSSTGSPKKISFVLKSRKEAKPFDKPTVSPTKPNIVVEMKADISTVGATNDSSSSKPDKDPEGKANSEPVATLSASKLLVKRDNEESSLCLSNKRLKLASDDSSSTSISSMSVSENGSGDEFQNSVKLISEITNEMKQQPSKRSGSDHHRRALLSPKKSRNLFKKDANNNPLKKEASGAERQNVLEKLLRQSTIKSYGNSGVGTWSGSRSENQSSLVPRSSTLDTWDRDYDKGKKKKIKKKHQTTEGHHTNMFQKFQNRL